jgi:hypothetical protein
MQPVTSQCARGSWSARAVLIIPEPPPTWGPALHQGPAVQDLHQSTAPESCTSPAPESYTSPAPAQHAVLHQSYTRPHLHRDGRVEALQPVQLPLQGVQQQEGVLRRLVHLTMWLLSNQLKLTGQKGP